MSPQQAPGQLPDLPTNYLKYQTHNPLVQYLIGRFLRRVIQKVGELHPESIADIGCGEGALAAKLDELGFAVRYQGYDVREEALALARELNPQRPFFQGDLFNLELPSGSADLVICLEVLEHLVEPENAVKKLASWSGRAALLSVPWEPFFQMGSFLRGKYLSAWGNHPEHLHHFNHGRLATLARTAFREVRVEGCFPWLLATCLR